MDDALILRIAQTIVAYYAGKEDTTIETKSVAPTTPAPVADIFSGVVAEIVKATPVTANSLDPKPQRIDALKKLDLRVLKRKAKEAAIPDIDIDDLSKIQLVQAIADWESIIGHTIDQALEQREDTEGVGEPEDDNDEVALDRSGLMRMSLIALKRYAVDEHELSIDDLRGLDKDSIADLILDEKPAKVEPTPEPVKTRTVPEVPNADTPEDDGEFFTEDEIRKLSLKELKEIADENEIEYPKNVLREGLVTLILEAMNEDDE